MRVGIAGLGLIGGSLALALARRHEVRGYDVDGAARRAAEHAVHVVGALDELVPADALIVATPLPSVITTIASLVPLARGAVIADTTSVRAPIDAFARDHAHAARLVGMHPMAGGTRSGFGSADADLFRGRPMLVVPTIASDDGAVALVSALAADTGAHVVRCEGAAHDRRVALTSALPLAVATALAAVADELGNEIGDYAGPGFRDTTRLADSRPELAEALLLANAGNVTAALARMRGALDAIEGAIADRDAPALRALLERAQAVRARLAQASAASIS